MHSSETYTEVLRVRAISNIQSESNSGQTKGKWLLSNNMDELVKASGPYRQPKDKVTKQQKTLPFLSKGIYMR